MRLYVFNPKSILNHTISRVVNGIFLAVSVLVLIVGSLGFPVWGIPSVLIISTIFNVAVCENGIIKTKFFEWDASERKKRTNFIIDYIFIATPLSIAIGIAMTILMNSIFESDIDWIKTSIFGVVTGFLWFNLLNIPSLYYPIFKNDLLQNNYLQKKPENWTDKVVSRYDDEDWFLRSYGMGN